MKPSSGVPYQGNRLGIISGDYTWRYSVRAAVAGFAMNAMVNFGVAVEGTGLLTITLDFQ